MDKLKSGDWIITTKIYPFGREEKSIVSYLTKKSVHILFVSEDHIVYREIDYKHELDEDNKIMCKEEYDRHGFVLADEALVIASTKKLLNKKATL